MQFLGREPIKSSVWRVLPFFLLATGAVVGCQHAAEAPDSQAANVGVGDRSPASWDLDAAREQAFRKLLAEGADPATLRVNYLDRLLKIYYRAELYVEDVEDNLNQVIEKQKANPAYRENVLDTENYAHELRLQALADRSLQDIEFAYRHLLETSKDNNAAEATRTRAATMVRAIYAWLDARPAEDRLMLSHLLERLTAVKQGFDAKVVRQDDYNARGIASVDYDFDKFNDHPSDMTGFVKAHKALIHKKALAAFKTRDAEMDAPVQKVQWMDRTPSSPEPIVPGLGVWGNVTGLSFPENTFVFTFDDGPQVANDVRLLSYMKDHKDSVNQHGIPTTFFWMVNSVANNAASIPLAKAAGVTMNNHTWTHPDLMTQTPEQLNHEINEANAYLLKAFGDQPVLKSNHFRFYRCPYGSCYQNSTAPQDKVDHANVIRKMIADLGLIHAYWTIDSHDWLLPHQQQRIFDLTTKQMLADGHGVILMHDIHDWTIDTAKMLFDWIQDQNDNKGGKIRLMSLEGAVDEYNKKFATPAPEAQ